MAGTEFDNSLHWGLFLTGTSLTSETGKYVRVSELVLSALRAAGVFSTMVDGIVAPATDKLWLDKNVDPAVLKEWDATGASWVPMTYDRLFGRAAVDKLTVTGGTGNAVMVSQPVGFQASRLYLMTPTQNNSAAATINVTGVGSYGVKYGNGADIGASEFTAGRQTVLFFTGVRFEVVFPLGELSATVLAAQASASAAAASQSAAAGSQSAAAASAALAQEFATKAEDNPITGFPGVFSALHWAAKAASYVAGNMGLAIHAFANKATLADADELVIADSQASWNGKRHTYAQLKAQVGLQTDGRLGDHLPGGTVLDADLMVGTGWYFYNSTTCTNGPLPNVPVGGGNGYILAFKQAQTGPSNFANKQVFYEAQGHRTFTRYRWYTAGWQPWVETTVTGKQSFIIRADELLPSLTVGPSLSVAQTVTNGHVLASLDFDSAVGEYAYFQLNLPKKWNLGQISFEVLWSGASAGSGGVCWQLTGSAVSDNDAIDTAISGAASSLDTYLGANLLHRSPESSAFTVSGSLAAGDVVFCRIARIVADAFDTLAQDAKLYGIKVYYTASAGNDA